MGSFISNIVTGYEDWETGSPVWVPLGSSYPNQLILTYTTSISSGNIILNLELRSSSGSGWVNVGPVKITIGDSSATIYSDRPKTWGNQLIWSNSLEYDGKTYSEASIHVSVNACFYAAYENCTISGTIALPKVESAEYTLTINPSNGSYIDENGNRIIGGFPEISFSDYGYIQICTDNEDAGAWFNETDGIKGYCISKPKKTGYYISGWKISNSSTGKELSSDYSIIKYSNTSVGDAYLLSPNPGMNVAAMVLWTPKTYTITYNANGGSGTMTNSTATYNVGFKTEKNIFTRLGYKFTGWNEKSDGSGTPWGITSSNSGTYESGKDWVWTYDKNITLYAQWEPWEVVRIYTNDGWKMAVPYVYTNEGWKRTAPYIYTSNGWKNCH